MNKYLLMLLIFLFLLFDIVVFFFLFLHGHDIAILHPAGMIAVKEKNLILIASLLSLFVILPVFFLTFFISWKYREGNRHAHYMPNWDHHLLIESLWWAIPCIIIFILAVITWTSSHELDPYKPLPTSTRPLTIEVIALPWKWLFIYPEQGIATVNFIQIPKQVPITFHITSDAPMNSFWIPRLGGQIYAMPGMSTDLHLIANEEGSYQGSSANLSGEGFSGMTFTVNSGSLLAFHTWVTLVKQSKASLTSATYTDLAKPSEDHSIAYYASVEKDLYNSIIMKYMAPSRNTLQSPTPTDMMPNMSGMDMR